MMELDLHYRDFVMDDLEFIFDYTPGSVPSFHDRDGNTYCAVAAFQHQDPDLARDPLLTNRRMLEVVDLAMFCTLVVAGPTPDHINVLIPDTVGPMVDAEEPLTFSMLWDSALVPRRISARCFLPQIWRPRYAITRWCRLSDWAGGPIGTR